LLGDLWQSPIQFQQFAALSQSLFLRAVGQKAEVTDAPVCVRHLSAVVWRQAGAQAGMKPSGGTWNRKRRPSGTPGAGCNEFLSIESHRF